MYTYIPIDPGVGVVEMELEVVSIIDDILIVVVVGDRLLSTVVGTGVFVSTIELAATVLVGVIAIEENVLVIPNEVFIINGLKLDSK